VLERVLAVGVVVPEPERPGGDLRAHVGPRRVAGPDDRRARRVGVGPEARRADERRVQLRDGDVAPRAAHARRRGGGGARQRAADERGEQGRLDGALRPEARGRDAGQDAASEHLTDLGEAPTARSEALRRPQAPA
jgi:hypothetical protein